MPRVNRSSGGRMSSRGPQIKKRFKFADTKEEVLAVKACSFGGILKQVSLLDYAESQTLKEELITELQFMLKQDSLSVKELLLFFQTIDYDLVQFWGHFKQFSLEFCESDDNQSTHNGAGMIMSTGNANKSTRKKQSKRKSKSKTKNKSKTDSEDDELPRNGDKKPSKSKKKTKKPSKSKSKTDSEDESKTE